VQVMQCQMPIHYGGSKCGTVPEFVPIGQTVPEIWPFFFDFQDGGHTLRRAKVRHLARFCANRSRRPGDMAVFDF